MISLNELKKIKSRVDGEVLYASDFISPDEVLNVETDDNLSVVSTKDGEYHFAKNSLKKRQLGPMEVPRDWKPILADKIRTKETTIMTNMKIDRVDSTDPAVTGNVTQNLEDTLKASSQLTDWATKTTYDDKVSLSEIMKDAAALPDLDTASLDIVKDFNNFTSANALAKAKSAGATSDAFSESTDFSGDAKPTRTPRPKLTPEEQTAARDVLKEAISKTESARSEEDQVFIIDFRGYISPYGFIPFYKPVTRNNGRLSAKLVNRIPASKRTFAIGVTDAIKATINPQNIPANLATAEYDIAYFESNPGPHMGILAFLPRNFDVSTLESLSTNTSRSKIRGWAAATGTSSEVVMRYVSRADMIYLMVATGSPCSMVDIADISVKSSANLEYFFKRMNDPQTQTTWYNIISRDTATNKAVKGTSAGYIPLNAFIQEVPSPTMIQTVSCSMLGGPLFNPPAQSGKSISCRFEELNPEGNSKLTGNTKSSFKLNDLSLPTGVECTSHKHRKDVPDKIKLKPAKVETYLTTKNVEKNRFVKVSFLNALDNPKTSLFEKAYMEDIKEYATLLQEAQKRKSTSSAAVMSEHVNTLTATNELLQGTLPQLGKKTKK